MIAAKVENALALDYPRERLELIVACDGCSDATAAARARGRRRPGARAAARRQDPRAGRRRRARARGDRRLLGRQRAVGARRGAGARRARSRIRASATPAARSASCRRPAASRRANQEGVYWRYELAVRALESRLSARSRRATARSTRPGASTYIVVDPVMGHDLSLPVQHGQARACARCTCPSARASEKMVPSLARRVRAQAADDEPHLADPAARRDALAARLPARLRADDHLPPPAALLHARPARDRAGGERRAAGDRRRDAVRGHARAAAGAARRGRAGRRAARSARC